MLKRNELPILEFDENKDAKILIAVKGSGGRVCLFDAEEFYKHYKSL